MPLWGCDCPFPALAALSCLSLAGDGLVHSQLPLLCPLFCEQAWQCLQFSSVAQLSLTLCDPMNCSTPGLLVHHQLPEPTQSHVHHVGDVIQPSHPQSSLLPLPSIFASKRVFSSESFLGIKWPKYWSFSFSISPSNEYSELISFRIDWFDLLAV